MKIIYYTADWCMPCKAFKPIVRNYGELLGFEVEEQDIDDLRDKPEVIISSIPTLVWYKNGNRVGITYGSWPPDAFRKKIREIFNV